MTRQVESQRGLSTELSCMFVFMCKINQYLLDVFSYNVFLKCFFMCFMCSVLLCIVQFMSMFVVLVMSFKCMLIVACFVFYVRCSVIFSQCLKIIRFYKRLNICLVKKSTILAFRPLYCPHKLFSSSMLRTISHE